MHTKTEKMEAFGRLLDVMDELREKCPWNAEQTMQSIRAMTEEEVYELSDAILKDSPKDICKEVGDILYHMVFYAKIGEEKGEFDIKDALDAVSDKMVFRHPHVFGPQKGEKLTAEQIADSWEIVKAKEKGGNKTVMSGIPDSMPALLKALSMQEKARGCGFDWQKKEDVFKKVEEETGEVREAIASGNKQDIEEEFGDLFFSLINAARLYDVDPEAALNRTCTKFRRRFDYIERSVKQEGGSLQGMTLEKMDALWDEAKAKGL